MMKSELGPTCLDIYYEVRQFVKTIKILYSKYISYWWFIIY